MIFGVNAHVCVAHNARSSRTEATIRREHEVILKPVGSGADWKIIATLR